MMTYNAILVDDEILAVEALRHLLKCHKEINIVASANNFTDAMREIKKHLPDILFLDVEMPGKSGFDIVKELKAENIHCDIIFTTAHEGYAVKAIKHAAFDFLLKPIDSDELAETIYRYIVNRGKITLERKLDDLLEHMNNDSKKIKLNTGTGYAILSPNDIMYCKAEGNYTAVHDVRNKRHFVTFNLGKLDKLLPGDHFFRVSRSAIINLSYINRIDRKTSTCELLKDKISFTIKVPPKQLKMLEKL